MTYCLPVDLATPVFHLFLPQMRMSVDAIVERALAAEDAGFEGIAFMDHLVPPLADEHDMWDAMTIVGWVLARTSTLGVGHLVLCDAFRHPAVLARQVASLDHASGGRFELGIGWGSAPEEFETFGIGSTAPRERVARLAESLQIMRALWAGDVVDHHGEHFTLTGARQRPLPTRQIPITIGGAGRRTLELVRAHADWWNVPVHQIGRMKRLREQTGGARVSMQTMVALVPARPSGRTSSPPPGAASGGPRWATVCSSAPHRNSPRISPGCTPKASTASTSGSPTSRRSRRSTVSPRSSPRISSPRDRPGEPPPVLTGRSGAGGARHKQRRNARPERRTGEAHDQPGPPSPPVNVSSPSSSADGFQARCPVTWNDAHGGHGVAGGDRKPFDLVRRAGPPSSEGDTEPAARRPPRWTAKDDRRYFKVCEYVEQG